MVVDTYYNLTDIQEISEVTRSLHYTKILVPLDGSGWSERAIVHAMEMARACQAELHIVHVYNPDKTAAWRNHTLPDRNRWRSENAQRYAFSFYNKLKKQGLNAFVSVVESGDMTGAVSRFVAEHGIDLVVMNMPQANPFERFFFGDRPGESRPAQVLRLLLALFPSDRSGFSKN